MSDGGTRWGELAACQGVDPELWYPGPGAVHHRHASRVVCRACPVTVECRREAAELERGVPLQYRWGIWAGLDPRERYAEDVGVIDPHPCGTVAGFRHHGAQGEEPCVPCAGASRSALRRQAAKDANRARRGSVTVRGEL